MWSLLASFFPKGKDEDFESTSATSETTRVFSDSTTMNSGPDRTPSPTTASSDNSPAHDPVSPDTPKIDYPCPFRPKPSVSTSSRSSMGTSPPGGDTNGGTHQSGDRTCDTPKTDISSAEEAKKTEAQRVWALDYGELILSGLV